VYVSEEEVASVEGKNTFIERWHGCPCMTVVCFIDLTFLSSKFTHLRILLHLTI